MLYKMTPESTVCYYLETVLFPTESDQSATFQGWIFISGNQRCSAVRARNGRQIFVAVSHLPRPDVAKKYPDEKSAAFSGFDATLPSLNRYPVRLEWMDEQGTWHEFWRENTVSTANRHQRKFRPLLPDTLIPAMFSTVATTCQAKSWSNAEQATARLLSDWTSNLSGMPDAQEEFRVCLDEPEAPVCIGNFIPISGWAFHKHAAIRRLFAHAAPSGAVHLIHPLCRPDVSAAYSNLDVSDACGFSGMIKLTSTPCSFFFFRLYAELSDGSQHLIFGQRYFRQIPLNYGYSRLRSALLLGAYAIAGRYRPQSWLVWLKVLVHLQRRLKTDTKPAPSTMTPPQRMAQPTRMVAPQDQDPLISILVPVFNPPRRYLEEMLASVRSQSYPRWELCLADDASTAAYVRPVLEAHARDDARIRPLFRSENGQIARATNTALQQARGEYIALLDHDDLLAPEALFRVTETIREKPDVQFLYTDRDKIDDHGRHFDQELRGAWNPAMAITHNYLHQLTVLRRSLIHRAGCFRADYFGSQDLDLYLRCHELLKPEQIVHVPFVAYHWRAHDGSTAIRGDQKDYMFDSARRGITDALQRRQLRAKPFLPAFAEFYGLNLHQLHWHRSLLLQNPVSIVLAGATRDESWRENAIAVANTVPHEAIQLIIVTDDSTDPAPSMIAGMPIEHLRAPAETTLAARFNLGANRAHHSLLLLLENNAFPRTQGWLEDLVGWLSMPDVAAVGPKLIASDLRVHSAGLTVNPQTGLPHAMFAGAPANDLGYQFLPHTARDSLLLDRAALLTRTAVFQSLGGYNDRRFPFRHFVADYCLRLHAHHQRVVFSPQAVLHLASVKSPDTATHVSEDATFRQLHPQAKDPWVRPELYLAVQNPPDQNNCQPSSWMPAGVVVFATGWFFLERPRPGAELPIDNQVLSGWCVPRPGHIISELRVMVGKRIRFLTYGHPRADIAAASGHTGTFLPAGFDLELNLAPGRARLEFEVRNESGTWSSIHQIEITVISPRQVTAKHAPASDTIKQLAEGGELLLESQAGASLTHRAMTLAQTVPWRDAIRSPALPFHGFWDEPTGIVRPVYNSTGVNGWLFHETQAIRRVVASFSLNEWLQLPHQKESTVIGNTFRDFPAARQCAIAGVVPVPPASSSHLTLRIWAELDDGSWHLVYLRRSWIQVGAEFQPAPARPVSQWVLLRTILILYWSLLRNRVPGPGLWDLPKAVHLLRKRFPRPESVEVPPLTPLPSSPAPSPPQVLLVTHNLNREGAPYFLLELALYLRKHIPCKFTVVSPFEGPLRAEFERAGIEVRLVDRTPLWNAQTSKAVQCAFTALAAELRMQEHSVVVANTIESFWAVQMARQAGRPSLFYIHEPGVFGLHYLNHLGAPTQRLARETLAQASTLVSFPSQATQAYYESFSRRDNRRIQVGWTDLDRILPDNLPRTRAAIRKQLGLSPADKLVINVGSICARKGQLVFVNAIEHLWRTKPGLAASCRFLLIGDHESDHGRMLVAQINGLHRPNINILPATPRIGDYYAAADMFVLSSFEEGFPRVLLEAMGFGLPIVSTAIHAIPEITRDGMEALLVPPADSPAMAAKIQLLLEQPELAHTLGRQAQIRVQEHFTAERVLPGHLKTLLELVPALATSGSKILSPDSQEPIPTSP